MINVSNVINVDKAMYQFKFVRLLHGNCSILRSTIDGKTINLEIFVVLRSRLNLHTGNGLMSRLFDRCFANPSAKHC